MDGLDWSKFQQQQELEEHLMIMPISPSNTTLLEYRDNCIPVQQLPKIDNSTPNFFPQWRSRSPFESIDCLVSASNQTDTTASIEDDGISFIFSTNKSSVNPNGNKRKRADQKTNQPQNINFQRRAGEEADVEAAAQMKEMMYQAAAFRPVEFGEEERRRPRRKNVRISSDPQTVAARERRERISERIRVLQRLVPGGSKMDTASMLDEAASYLKFLRSQVKALEAIGAGQRIINDPTANLAFAYSPPYLTYPMAVQPPQFSIQGPNPVRKPESC